MSNEDILYEIKELHQWKLDREQLNVKNSESFTKILHKLNPWRLLPKKDTDIFEFYRPQLPWLFAVPNEERTLLAVLVEKFLEIRHKHNDYQTPIGRASVPLDENPSWRKLTWSSDGIVVALATSNGELKCYDALANLICSIPKVDCNYDANSSIPSGAIASLILIEKRTKNSAWPYELLALEYTGKLRSYLVSSTQDYKPYHTFSFGDTILSAATYIHSFKILVVAFPTSNLMQNSPYDTLGLSTWRLLNDYPYYNLVNPSIDNLSVLKTKKSWNLFFSNKNNRIVVLKMTSSLDGLLLACVHSCGAVSVWTLPQMIMRKIWYLQHESIIENEIAVHSNNAGQEFVLSDLNWCSNTNLAMTFNNGMMIVCGIDNVINLLANISSKDHIMNRGPQFVYPYAKLVNVCNINDGFLLMNCERKEFSSWRRASDLYKNDYEPNQEEDTTCNTIEVNRNTFLKQILKFFVHFEFFQQQNKYLYVEKTYRLMCMKSVTPEELYKELINAGEYKEAIDFAGLFNLDENFVYKKQWETSHPVTIESIENYLLKITNKWWIIYQCCKRIPETLPAAQALLNYGLQFTDFDSFLNCDETSETENSDSLTNFEDINRFDFNFDKTTGNFTKNQLRIIHLRRHLLLYLNVLNVYKEIMEISKNISYTEEMYYKFRTESPLSVVINFARDGNTKAMAIMFTYYGDEILPFWLQILDNIPECVSPSNYKQLLPKFNERSALEVWKCKHIREADWSESGEFKDLIQPKITKTKEYSNVHHFPFSIEDSTKWYTKKIRRIVEESGLIDYALELLNLARKNNIPDLKYLENNLLVLDTLMYTLMMEDKIILTEIENLSDDDKLMLLMSKSNLEESFSNDISNILLPFLNRCETLRPGIRDSILDNFLKHLSKDDLNLSFLFIKHICENDEDFIFDDNRKIELGLLCIYACQRIDQLDTAFRILQYLPEDTDNNNTESEELFNLQSRVTDLQIELQIIEILQVYGIYKTVQVLHDSKNDPQFQNDIFTLMVNAKVNTAVSKQDIFNLLSDMMFIQEDFFNSLPSKTYLQIFAYTMLTSKRYDCIEEYASLGLYSSDKLSSQRADSFLSYSESVSTIIEAVQYYFTIATSYEDSCISYAKSCLALVNLHSDIENEKKFIDALKELDEFDVRISPLEVRMKIDKMRLIEEVLKQKPKAYKNINRLLSLAKNLEIDENKKNALELNVLNCAVNAAFQLKDYSWCSIIVRKLIENDQPCWNICKKLCECDEYTDLETKQNLIKYAMLQCPDRELLNLVDLRNEIERKILRERFRSCVRKKTSRLLDGDGSRIQQSNGTCTKPEKNKDNETQYGHVSSFINLIQTSSSNVLNVNFWKNTFHLSSNQTTDAIASNSNAECEKLAFSEYYQDLHRNCGCICLQSGKNPAESEKEILSLLLRLYLLSSSTARDDDTGDLTEANINEVIAQLATMTFPDDCLFSLCLLFHLNDKAYSEKVFNSLPNTNIVEKFALFFYCLKYAINSNFSTKGLDLRNCLPELFSQALNSTQDLNSHYVELINKYKISLEKHRNVDKLRDLGCGIDSVRFFSDETYKIDSVLGLAMYEERDKLDLALNLGAEHEVPSEDIIFSHIISLFLGRNLSVLTERLKEPLVLDTLKSKSDYAIKRIISDIYDGLYGCDYQILLLYYALLNQVAENKIFNHLKPKDHMKLLRKLKPFSKTIDYKMLTAEPARIVEAVIPAVFSHETTSVARLITSLPSELKQNSTEDVFEKLAEKTFFNGPANYNYHKRFEACCVFFEKLTESQITKIMQNFIFSKRSYENIDSSSRKKILDGAIEFFSSKIESEETNLVEKLKNYSLQFQKIEDLNNISNAFELNESYLSELQTALIFKEEENLRKVIVTMVLDSAISTDIIKVILEFVRVNSLTDILTELLNNASDLDNNIEPLLQRIVNCLEDNDYEKCWCDSLEILLENRGISENVRTVITNILSILQRSDDQIYCAIELLHETRLTLREWITVCSSITLFDVHAETPRFNLIKILLKKVTTFAQIANVYKLLIFWPPFDESNNWKNDPWMLLLEKLLSLDENTVVLHEENLKLTHKIILKCRFSKEKRRRFFDYVGNLQHNKILLVWFCVLVNDELLIHSVESYIIDLRKNDNMPKIIDEYLRKKNIENT